MRTTREKMEIVLSFRNSSITEVPYWLMSQATEYIRMAIGGSEVLTVAKT